MVVHILESRLRRLLSNPAALLTGKLGGLRWEVLPRFPRQPELPFGHGSFHKAVPDVGKRWLAYLPLWYDWHATRPRK